MSHNWLHTPDCKVSNKNDKPPAYVGVTDLGACACALQLLNKIASSVFMQSIKILL